MLMKCTPTLWRWWAAKQQPQKFHQPSATPSLEKCSPNNINNTNITGLPVRTGKTERETKTEQEEKVKLTAAAAD